MLCLHSSGATRLEVCPIRMLVCVCSDTFLSSISFISVFLVHVRRFQVGLKFISLSFLIHCFQVGYVMIDSVVQKSTFVRVSQNVSEHAGGVSVSFAAVVWFFLSSDLQRGEQMFTLVRCYDYCFLP